MKRDRQSDDTQQQDQPNPRAPTIRDVARAAGVAVGTASQALNSRGKMRPETRQRVGDAAIRLGYHPNALVQSLLRGRTYTVGLLSTDRYGRFSLPLLEGVEDVFSAARISVFLCDARDTPEIEKQHIGLLLSKQVDGIIVTGRRIDPRPPIDLGNATAPHLYAFAQTTVPDALCLVPDDAQGAYLATEHLIQSGRRHLAHIAGPGQFESARRRQEGMEAALREHGLGLPPRRVLSGRWHAHWGYEAALQLIDTDSAIDAIFCGADLLAWGAIDALHERGVRVPDDVAVVGFDNWEPISTGTRPPLTTVDMNLHELGRQAGLQLLELVEGERHSGIVRLPCSLVIRESA